MELNIEYLPIEALRPYDRNARKHAKKDIDAIAASIQEFGFDDPIGIWGDGLIVEGHGRLLAAKQMGMTSVPCIRLDHLTDEQRRAYTLAHNRTAELSGWDFDMQAAELAEISEIDMEEFGFDAVGDWFDRDERDGAARQEGNDEYNEFLDKFEPKKTTDDCYTPDLVYEAVADWVAHEYSVDRSQFVRPFFPGGDYQKYSYKDGQIVVDNPPFSILAEITRWYLAKGVPFFLFAPALTQFNSASTGPGCCCICAGATIVYENKAVVSTSFITTLEEPGIVARTAPSLFEAVKAATDKLAEESRVDLNRNIFPDHVVTAALMQKWSHYGVDFRVRRGEALLIDALDAQKAVGQAIFGHGLLLSERAAAERAAATKWRLSEREKSLVAEMSGT